jgi:AraC-like DNA-binding protein/mannose-6-phosphate isomerase-like protein (cupin superfamily)
VLSLIYDKGITGYSLWFGSQKYFVNITDSGRCKMQKNILIKSLNYDDLEIQVNLGRINISVQYLRCMPTFSGWKSIRHCHSSYELHFIPYGYGKVAFDDAVYDIKPGTFYLTGPGIYHLQTSDVNDPMVEYCIDFNINKCKSRDIFISKSELDSLTNIILNTKFWFGEDLYGTIPIFEKIFDELDKKMIGYNLTIASYITQILINTARSYVGIHRVNYEFPVKTLDSKRESVIGSFLEEKCGENLKLSDAADLLCTSVRQTERIFKQVYGKGFKQVLNAIRVEKAIQLLTVTSIPVELISQKVGYSSSSYFGRIFKSHTGKTPQEFRNNRKNN